MRWVIVVAFSCGSDKSSPAPAPAVANSCVLDARGGVTAHEVTGGTVETLDSSTPPPPQPTKDGNVYGALVGSEAGEMAPLIKLDCSGRELDVVVMVRGPIRPHHYTFPNGEGAVSGLGKHKWLGRTGIVDIATVNHDRVAGTIDVTGELLGGGTIAVTGTFDLPLISIPRG